MSENNVSNECVDRKKIKKSKKLKRKHGEERENVFIGTSHKKQTFSSSVEYVDIDASDCDNDIGFQDGLILNSTESEQDTMTNVILLDDSDSEDDAYVNNQKNNYLEAHQKGNTKETPLDWFSPLHHLSSVNYKHNLKVLKERGILRKEGRWTSDEVEQLEDNMKTFVSTHDVKDLEGLIGMRTKEDRAFRRKTQFVLSMCTGIQRTNQDVAAKIITHFSDFHCKGALSNEEQAKLIKLRLLGTRWKEIGMLMSRNYLGLPNTHDHLTKTLNRGSWNSQEDEALIKAVKGYMDRGEQISWAQVSKAVATRSYASCYCRWFSKSIQSNLTAERIVLDQKEIYDLVSLIHESNVDDEYFIDWNNLSKHFNNKVSPSWLRWKFGVICKEVPHSHKLEFDELVEQLYEIYQRKVDNENSDFDKNNGIVLEDDSSSSDDNENVLSSDNSSQNKVSNIDVVIVID